MIKAETENGAISLKLVGKKDVILADLIFIVANALEQMAKNDKEYHILTGIYAELFLEATKERMIENEN